MSLTLTDRLTEEATSRFAQTSRWKLHYNEAGSGPPVVLLHGSGPGATGWSNFGPNLGALSEHFRVLALDAPGWGRSDAVTLEERDHVGAVVELLDALEIDKAAVVGNSMGGMTALKLAALHPDRVSHLVTMGSGAPGVRLFGFGDGPTEGLKVLQAAYRDPSPASMKHLVEVMTFDPAHASDALAEQRSENALARPDHLANFIAGIGQRSPSWPTAEEVASIRTPTLLIHGRDDRVVHYENSLALLALVPDSRLVLLNRCGHWAQVEHASEFNRLVLDFVRSTN
jgi:2-hydroxy-6-oxonona-2,4-dienedioate hydrolase